MMKKWMFRLSVMTIGIVLGMPKEFYEGYDREISEVFSYKMSDR